MAEFIMKYLVERAGLSEKISVASMGCQAEVYSRTAYGTCHELEKNNIPYNRRLAVQLEKSDYKNFDYIIGMDFRNVSDIKKICGGDPDKKVYLMMNFAGENRDVDDPYYTDDYETTYKDLILSCGELLKFLQKKLNEAKNV